MKQSAVKALGVAALGAAFAAVGAGAASAAPAGPVGLGTVTGAVKAPEVPETVPASGSVNKALSTPEQVVDGVDQAKPLEQVDRGIEAAQPMAEKGKGDGSVLSKDATGDLLGGLPVAGVADNGLPLR